MACRCDEFQSCPECHTLALSDNWLEEEMAAMEAEEKARDPKHIRCQVIDDCIKVVKADIARLKRRYQDCPADERGPWLDRLQQLEETCARLEALKTGEPK